MEVDGSESYFGEGANWPDWPRHYICTLSVNKLPIPIHNSRLTSVSVYNTS